GAQQVIYQVFLRGRATAPYASRIPSLLVKVVVGCQSSESDISSSQSHHTTSLVGLPATMSWNIVVGTGSGSTKWQTTGGSAEGPITVSWEGCPRSDDPTPT